MCRRADIASNNWCVDHDHDTGLIRGVLCRNCNRAEGKIDTWVTNARDTLPKLKWLENLVEYLNQSPTTYVHHLHKTEDEKRLERNRKQRLLYAKKKAGL